MVKCEWTPEGVRVACAWCEREFLVTGITEAQFLAWKSGSLIQAVMPEISPEVRELLISGTCDKCWKHVVGPDV